MEVNSSNSIIFTNEEKSNKVRTNLLLITEIDIKEFKKTQQSMLINSTTPSKPEEFVIHLNEENFKSKINSEIEKLSTKQKRKVPIKLNEIVDYKDEFFNDFQKISHKQMIASKKNENFLKKNLNLEKRSSSSISASKKSSGSVLTSAKKSHNQIEYNLENRNLTNKFLSNPVIYKRVKQNFYYLRSLCNSFKMHPQSPSHLTKYSYGRKNTNNTNNSEHFREFEEILMIKENIADEYAAKMRDYRNSSLKLFDLKKLQTSRNLVELLTSPQKKRRNSCLSNTELQGFQSLLNSCNNISPVKKLLNKNIAANYNIGKLDEELNLEIIDTSNSKNSNSNGTDNRSINLNHKFNLNDNICFNMLNNLEKVEKIATSKKSSKELAFNSIKKDFNFESYTLTNNSVIFSVDGENDISMNDKTIKLSPQTKIKTKHIMNDKDSSLKDYSSLNKALIKDSISLLSEKSEDDIKFNMEDRTNNDSLIRFRLSSEDEKNTSPIHLNLNIKNGLEDIIEQDNEIILEKIDKIKYKDKDSDKDSDIFSDKDIILVKPASSPSKFSKRKMETNKQLVNNLNLSIKVLMESPIEEKSDEENKVIKLNECKVIERNITKKQKTISPKKSQTSNSLFVFKKCNTDKIVSNNLSDELSDIST